MSNNPEWNKVCELGHVHTANTYDLCYVQLLNLLSKFGLGALQDYKGKSSAVINYTARVIINCS